MSGYCKHCDTLTNSIVQIFEGKMLIWVGCIECYEKRKEIENDVTVNTK